jgi:hypothetical protein
LQLADLFSLNYTELIPEHVHSTGGATTIKAQKEVVKEIDRVIAEQGPINKSSRKAVFDFLNEVKKKKK